MILALSLSSALAISPVRELAVGVSATGESVLQGGLVEFYPKLGGSLSGEGIFSLATIWPVEVGLQLGYRRIAGKTSGDDDSWIWYVPATLLASGRLDLGSVSLLGGLGPSIVAWQERASPAEVSDRKDWGARWGLLTEASVRWHSPFLRASLREPSQGPAGIDLFVSMGARFSHVSDAAVDTCTSGEDCGFDWSAIRLGGGALVRF